MPQKWVILMGLIIHKGRWERVLGSGIVLVICHSAMVRTAQLFLRRLGCPRHILSPLLSASSLVVVQFG
ncbi:MAG TPA: hypothetical protein VMH04_13415 [Candidatus Solibacter sp.]|nr:hypothetical protein [Candidatus Solibacter sp.]